MMALSAKKWKKALIALETGQSGRVLHSTIAGAHWAEILRQIPKRKRAIDVTRDETLHLSL